MRCGSNNGGNNPILKKVEWYVIDCEKTGNDFEIEEITVESFGTETKANENLMMLSIMI